MMIRTMQEQWERDYLSEYAALSANSKGRDREEDQCDLRTVFQRDRDRILHCKAFRRLKHKTQVFLEPEGDHYRTRLTHTLEVSQNARTIARALRLNEDLTEAIALGHDLGHTPFGHAGERALNEVCPFGFEHNVQSVRVVEVLERDGEGLNLTAEVKDGMLNHQMKSRPFTLEGRIVRYSDKLAYIHHDMDDAIRAKVLTDNDVPKDIGDILGHATKERLDHLIHNIIATSLDKDDILMEPEVEQAMLRMRKFMFENVYQNPVVKAEESKAESLVKTLYEYYAKNKDKLPVEYKRLMDKGESAEQVACDFIASMTDHFAITTYEELYIPKSWHG
jgi:dGTPase